MNVEGNDTADRLAKEAAQDHPLKDTRPTVSFVKAEARRCSKKMLQDLWSENAPDSYKDLKLAESPDGLGLPRRTTAQLLAHRSEHGTSSLIMPVSGTENDLHARAGLPTNHSILQSALSREPPLGKLR